MCKYFHSFVLLLAAVSSYVAHILLHHAGMLVTNLNTILAGHTFSSPFKQTELTVPSYDPVAATLAGQVSDFNLQLSQSYPTYYSFIAGSLNKTFLVLTVLFTLAFVWHVYSMFKCCGKECKK